MSRLFLVTGESGEYDDHRSWPVLITATEEEASKACVVLNYMAAKLRLDMRDFAGHTWVEVKAELARRVTAMHPVDHVCDPAGHGYGVEYSYDSVVSGPLPPIFDEILDK